MQTSLTDSQPNVSAEPLELESPGVPKQIAAKLARDIDDYAIRAYFEPHRNHLGASLIGHECHRYLWYVFRWCGHEDGSGDTPDKKRTNLARMQRLFNRGHREEHRYVEFLTGIGAQVWQYDESQPRKPDGTFPQFRMKAVGGHFGGSLDAIIQLPKQYRIDERLLGEFKTNGTGAKFEELKKKGVNLAKQQHFTQMSCYGREYRLRYACYFNVNKNDDDIHIEVVKLDWNLAEQSIAKAERIIGSQQPLPKLSLDPTFHVCAYCAFKKVCHEGAPPEMNCRSCINCEPRSEAQWFCNRWSATIPQEVIPKGCDQYKAITNG